MNVSHMISIEKLKFVDGKNRKHDKEKGENLER